MFSCLEIPKRLSLFERTVPFLLFYSLVSSSVPPGAPSQVVASGLRPGPDHSPQAFNGCIHNVRINGEAQDLSYPTAGVGGKVRPEGRLENHFLACVVVPDLLTWVTHLILFSNRVPIIAFLPIFFCCQSDGVLAGCHSCSVCAEGTCREGGEAGVTCDCPPGRDGVLCAQMMGHNPCVSNR